MNDPLRAQLDRAFGENGARLAEPVGDRIAVGARNDTLTSLAGTMRRRGMGQDAIFAALVEENAARCDPPLERDEVLSIARSIARKPPGDEPFLSDATREGVPSETKIVFQTAREIGEATPETVRYVVRPWLARGAITELTGKAKAAGKTTWMMAMVRAKLDGRDFMGEPTEAGPVVYLTEERPTTFREALRRAGLLDRDDLHVLHYHQTAGVKWPDVVKAATDKALEVGADTLVVDTVSQFAGLKGEEEQAAGHALDAVRPLQDAAALDLAVLSSRHERKAGGAVGDAGRGSTAFAGAADTVLSLRRLEGNAKPTSRIIYSLSRFDETPDALVIDLTEGGYIAIGSETDVAVAEARAAILTALPVEEDAAITEIELVGGTVGGEQIAGLLPETVKRTTARSALRQLVEENRIRRLGAGKRGDAYRYSGTVEVSDATPHSKCQKENE